VAELHVQQDKILLTNLYKLFKLIYDLQVFRLSSGVVARKRADFFMTVFSEKNKMGLKIFHFDEI